MRRSSRYPRSFSLRALFHIHSSPSYTKKAHSHRPTPSRRRNYHTPRTYVPAPPPSYSYYYPQGMPPFVRNLKKGDNLIDNKPDPTPPLPHKHKHRHKPKPKSAYITNLPPELKHSLHSHLDPVSSACLGLSSRHFYPIHYSQHPHVSLMETGSVPPPSSTTGHRSRTRHPLPLAMLLRKDRDKYGQTQWCPPAEDYELDWKGDRFVRKRREGEERKPRYVWEEGRREREQEMRRLWGREGRLMRRSGYYRDLDVGGYRWR